MGLDTTQEAHYLSLKQDYAENPCSSLKKKCREYVNETIGRMKFIVKDWFLHTAFEFINSRKFTIQEEELMEEISNFYLKKLEELK